jgi:D-alanyl-lipoteichoic acid acyltransferase DltB (MBOAT superfamily)
VLFNSAQFAVFFPVVTILFFASPHRVRWALLLAASCYFYMVFVPVYILILVFTILVDYAAGLLIERAQGARRRMLLASSLCANLGVLALFKYWDFLAANLKHLEAWVGIAAPVPMLELILPIGLSFHTFQAMSYTIEVYRGRYPAERHLGIFALYVLFYPQLVAGPIERPYNLLPQLRLPHGFDYLRVRDGLQRMAWGFVKKMVIADRLGVLVDQVYATPTSYTGWPLILATLFFAVQIYCDFSGYSDIAIGAAQVMGFRLMENFRQPYLATSVAEFWRRWHISLSSWFRDYLYIPLGGSRVPWPRRAANLLLVFLLSGLWHGAAWTFVIWGATHGLLVLAHHLGAPVREQIAGRLLPGRGGLRRALQVALTFSLVCATWVFFRAQSIGDAVYVLTHAFRGLRAAGLQAAFPSGELVVAFAVIGLLAGYELLEQRIEVRPWLNRQPAWLRWAVYYSTGLTLIVGAKLTEARFIYFQF